MPNFNQVVIVGHLVRPLEVRQAGDTLVGRSTIAETEKYKDKEKTLFLDFEIWGKGAEILATYTAKGSAILLSGKLEQSNWEDENGNKKSRLFLKVESFQFLGGKKDAGTEQEVEDLPF